MAGPLFVFPGAGSQWAGMGESLMRSSPVFASRLRELREVTGLSATDSLDRIDVYQPALFAMAISLVEVWRSHGFEPAAVLGHSIGEFAAAYVSGAFSLADATRIAVSWAQAQATLSGNGSLVSVQASEHDVTRLLAEAELSLELAVVNGPTSVAVSGDLADCEKFKEILKTAGIRARDVPAGYGAHSFLVERLRARQLRALATVRGRASAIPFYSSTTGGRLDTTALDAEYWCRCLREQVRFDRALSRAVSDGFSPVIEISPHPVLVSAMRQALPDVPVFESISRRRPNTVGAPLSSRA